MEATPRFELGIKVLQTTALPLGYVAILARVAGFEPAHDGIRIHCLTAWRYPIIRFTLLKKLGWIVGFEPTHTGATTLCLNHLTIPTTSLFLSAPIYYTYLSQPCKAIFIEISKTFLYLFYIDFLSV